MPDLTRSESIAFNADLNRYYAEEEAAEKRRVAIDDLIAFKTEEALNDQKVFDTLDDDYEVIDRGQVMRALRSLDAAIKDFNVSQELGLTIERNNIDSVFTAISNIQNNFTEAVKHEAETEYERNL